MELILKTKGDMQASALFVPVLEERSAILKLLKSLGYKEDEALVDRLNRENFQGKKGQSFILMSAAKVVVLLGTGQPKTLAVDNWRELAGQIIAYLRTYSVRDISLVASHWLKDNQDIKRLGQALAEGLTLANYQFNKYKKDNSEQIKVDIKTVSVYLSAREKISFAKGWEYGQLLSQATILARDLVNEPASIMTPSFLAKEAIRVAGARGRVKVNILEKSDVKKLGMNAFMAIDRGSNELLKFIHLSYKPKGKVRDKIAIVGKGITFDSGGLNIKPWDGMYQMKNDMSGAATVIGLFSVLDKIQPQVEIHGIIAACENMPSGTAIKPGDVVFNMDGKSIEIAHTDAEGRVTLADALAYAQKQGIKKIVDIATLTGAVMMALGPNYAGLFANNKKLADSLLKYSELSGEKVWLLPLVEEYRDFNKSKIADIRNISSSKLGGAITAALFLQDFIKPDVAWAHLDIAAVSYAEEPFNSYTPIGGVGFGVRSLLEWLVNF